MDTKAFFQLSYGVYLLSTAHAGKENGCIINTACQVTSSPLQITVTVNKENLTCRMIAASEHFAVHVLTEDAHMEFIGRYGFKSGTDIRKFAGMDVKRDALGNPVLLDSAEVGAVLSCKVVAMLDVGTHVIFVGEVADAVVTGYGKPMTYAYYHAVKRGATPPKASAFVPQQAKPDQTQWRCQICGHIHTGEEPPEVCPVCKQDKSNFVKV